jgi:cyclophilin family peptidyl-prolyl cis-trans isomerase
MTPSLAHLVLALAQAAGSPPPLTPSASPRPAPTGPVVVLDTSFGRITIGLYKDKAPISVDNFLKYVHSGHYDGTIFHRVISTFMIQGGGHDASGGERPTRPPIRNEAKNGLRNSRGTVAMARTSDPDSATAQFFINVRDNHSLDFGIGGAGYAVFGDVLDGMDVVDKIRVVPTGSQDAPLTPVVIKTAREVASAPPAAKPASSPPPSPKKP